MYVSFEVGVVTFSLVDHVLVVAFSVHGAHTFGRIRFVDLGFVVV